MSPTDPIPEFPSWDLSKEEIDILRRMSPSQKFRAAQRLYDSARQLKEAALRQAHPDWSDEAIRLAVREAFLHARD